MPTLSVSEEKLPDKVGGIVHDALVDALKEQGLDVPANELQNIKNLVEQQAQALAEGLAHQAAAEEYLASDEFEGNEEKTQRKAPTRAEQETEPTAEGEVEKEIEREEAPKETQPAETPQAPEGAQPEAPKPTTQPTTLPTGIHAEAQPQEPGEEAIEGQGETIPPEIAEARSRIQDGAFEAPPETREAPPTPSRREKSQPKKEQQSERPPEGEPQQPQEAPPQEEPVPGAPSGDITPQEGAQQPEEEKRDKAETPKQADEPETEQQQEAETKKAQQQARLEQGAAQTGEIAEAEKELKTLTDKARQFGPSLGKMLLPVVDAVQEFLPLLDTGFIAGLVSIVTTTSKVLWFMSQGAHLKEFVWKKAKARFAISSIIEIIPWVNWIPSALLTDLLTLRNIREKRTEFTTQINALTAKIKKLGARR